MNFESSGFLKFLTFTHGIYISGYCGTSSSKKVECANNSRSISKEIFLYTQQRELGLPRNCSKPPSIIDEYVSQRMPLLFAEKEFPVGKINKIFTSQWLNDKQVVFGTKCNKVSTGSRGQKHFNFALVLQDK